MWTQSSDPVGNIFVSALVAALPIAVLFWALAIRRMRGHTAGLCTTGVAVIVAVAVYRMPVRLALAATLHGALYGLFPIGWIVVAAVFLYRVTVEGGQFDIIKNSIAAITEDRRLQALLIAFSFGAFLEGAAGFGTPVAISAAMLVGLGFEPLQAAGLCLIANTAPVAFGAIGTPVIAASQVTGIDDRLISQMVGRQLPIVSVIVPFWLVFTLSGRRGVREVWPAALVCGGSFALAQWWTSNYLGPMLPDIVASLCSILCLVLFLRVWTPPRIFRLANDRQTTAAEAPSPARAFKAWSPFLVLTILVGTWGVRPVKAILDRATLSIPFPWLHNAITSPGTAKPLASVFSFNWLSATGTVILIAALVAVTLTGIGFSRGARVFGRTLTSLAAPLVTVAAVLGFAYLGNASGMTTTMGLALARTRETLPALLTAVGLARRLHDGFRHLSERRVRTPAVGIGSTDRHQPGAGRCGQFVGRRDGQDGVAAVDCRGLRGDRDGRPRVQPLPHDDPPLVVACRGGCRDHVLAGHPVPVARPTARDDGQRAPGRIRRCPGRLEDRLDLPRRGECPGRPSGGGGPSPLMRPAPTPPAWPAAPTHTRQARRVLRSA